VDLAEQSVFPVQPARWRAMWKLARPHQWSKNALIFAALIFSQRLFHWHDFVLTVMALVAFCAVSSVGYIVNDISDREADRRHPEKRHRPIASGALKVGDAAALACVLGAVGTLFSAALGSWFVCLTAAYVALQFAYSLRLKHMVIVDIITIAVGFVMRAFAGGVAIQVDVSPWLIFITFALALLLALARRRHELIALGVGAASHRSSLDHYSVRLIDQMISIFAATTLVGYMIYTASPDVERKLGTGHLYLTVPFVVLGILRYLYLIVEKGEGGDPSRLLLKDRTLLMSVVLWVAADVIILYF